MARKASSKPDSGSSGTATIGFEAKLWLAAATALTLEDKLAAQKQIKAAEVQRNDKRRSLFETQDAIDQQREDLIGTIEGKFQQVSNSSNLFTIHWQLR